MAGDCGDGVERWGRDLSSSQCSSGPLVLLSRFSLGCLSVTTNSAHSSWKISGQLREANLLLGASSELGFFFGGGAGVFFCLFFISHPDFHSLDLMPRCVFSQLCNLNLLPNL